MQKPFEVHLFPGIFGISAIWRNWTQIGPKYLKSLLGRHRKQSKVFSSSFHIKWSFTQMQKPSEGPVLPVFEYLGHQGNLVNWNYGWGNTGSNREFSVHHFTSNDALLRCWSHLKVEFYLFQRIWFIRAIWGKLGPNRVQISEIMVRDTEKVIRSLQVIMLH